LNVFKEKLATCQERPKCPQIIFWKTTQKELKNTRGN
jgi:hypothetical protein